MSDGWAGWEESADERSKASQSALLSDIDRMLGEFRASVKPATSDFSSTAPVLSRSESVAANLESMLSSSHSSEIPNEPVFKVKAQVTSEDYSCADEEIYVEVAGPTAIEPDSIFDQGPETPLQKKGTVLKEVQLQ